MKLEASDWSKKEKLEASAWMRAPEGFYEDHDRGDPEVNVFQ